MPRAQPPLRSLFPSSHRSAVLPLCLLFVVLAVLLSACSESAPVAVATLAPGERQVAFSPDHPYQPFELVLGAGAQAGNPYARDDWVTAVFTGSDGEALGHSLRVYGFWDGGNTWRIRFAPVRSGTWQYRVESPDRAIDGIRGELRVTPAPASARRVNPLLGGFLEPAGKAWRLSDGSRFFPVGDSQWSLLEEYTLDELTAWIDALAHHRLNTLHGTVWLAKYTRSGVAPFVDREPRSGVLDLAYFRQLDDLIRYANSKGIIPGLAIAGFPANTRWYDRFENQAQHDRWFRYIIDRYSAFNVRWLLFGEIDEAAPPWLDDWRQASRFYAALVKQRDPYRHPLGSHHTRVDDTAAVNPDIDYIEVQIPRSGDQYRQLRDYLQWNKPLWVEEYWYAPQAYDNDITVGIRNTHQNFLAALAFPTMGGLMRAHSQHADFVPRRARAAGLGIRDYLLEHDLGLQRLAEFKAFYRDLDLQAFTPDSGLCDRRFCTRFGDDVAVFLVDGGTVAIDLRAHSGTYSVLGLDVHNGRRVDYGEVQAGGIRRIDTGSSGDTALIFRRR